MKIFLVVGLISTGVLKFGSDLTSLESIAKFLGLI